MCVLFQCTIFCHAQYYYQVGVFTADKFNTGVFASDIFIQAKLLSGVFTAGGITEWSKKLMFLCLGFVSTSGKYKLN